MNWKLFWSGVFSAILLLLCAGALTVFVIAFEVYAMIVILVAVVIGAGLINGAGR